MFMSIEQWKDAVGNSGASFRKKIYTSSHDVRDVDRSPSKKFRSRGPGVSENCPNINNSCNVIVIVN